MLKLLFQGAMIPGEFMDEDDRRAASSFLVVQPYAVISGSKSHGQLRFQPLKRRSRSMETPVIILSVRDIEIWSWRMKCCSALSVNRNCWIDERGLVDE